MAVLVRTEVLGSLFAMHTMDAHMGLLCTGSKQTREIESYLLCPLFGYNVLSNFVADMLGGQGSASSRNLSGCFAVTTGQSERAAAKIADAMLITLQTAVLTHFSKSRATEADAQALEEAADLCANLSCIVILKGTVATEHVGDAVSYRAFCFGCESTPDGIANEVKKLHNMSRGESFHVSEAGPSDAAAAQHAGGDERAVVDLVSDNEGEEDEGGKEMRASAPRLSHYHRFKHPKGCSVAYPRDLALVGGPFGCMAQFLCPRGVAMDDDVQLTSFENNEWSNGCLDKAEKEVEMGKERAVQGTGGGEIIEDLCQGYYEEACERVAKLWSNAWKHGKTTGGGSEMMTVHPTQVEGQMRGVEWVEDSMRRGGPRPHLVISSSVAAAIMERGLDEGEREGIGLLFGKQAGDSKSGDSVETRVQLCAVVQRSEAESSCCRALLSDIEGVRARVSKEHNLDLVGWYHTHPPNPDYIMALCPSRDDIEHQQQTYLTRNQDFVGLIASVSRERSSLVQAGISAFVVNRDGACRIRWEVRDEPFVPSAMCAERFVNISTALREVCKSNGQAVQSQDRPFPKDTASSCRIGLAALQVTQQVMRAELAVAQLWRDLEVTRVRFSDKFSDQAIASASTSKSGAGGGSGVKRVKGDALPPLPGERGKPADVHCMCAHLMNAGGVGQAGSRGSRGPLDTFLRDEEEKELDEMPLPALMTGGSSGRRGDRRGGGGGNSEAQSKAQDVRGRGEWEGAEDGGGGSGGKRKRNITRGDGQVVGETSSSGTIIHMDEDDSVDYAKANNDHGEGLAGIDSSTYEEPSGIESVAYQEESGMDMEGAGSPYDERRRIHRAGEQQELEQEVIVSSCPEVDGEEEGLANVPPEDPFREHEEGEAACGFVQGQLHNENEAEVGAVEGDVDADFRSFQNRQSKKPGKFGHKQQHQRTAVPPTDNHVSSIEHDEWAQDGKKYYMEEARQEELQRKRQEQEDQALAKILQEDFNNPGVSALDSPSSSSKALRNNRSRKCTEASNNAAMTSSSSSNGNSSSSWAPSGDSPGERRSVSGRTAAKDGRDKLKAIHAEGVADEIDDDEFFAEIAKRDPESVVKAGSKKSKKKGRRDSDNGEDEDSDFVPEFKNTEWRHKKKKS